MGVLSSLSGLRGSGVQKSQIVGIVFARYVALPLIGIVIVRGAFRFGLVHSDPLYQFVLLLQYAVPPAMNIGTYPLSLFSSLHSLKIAFEFYPEEPLGQTNKSICILAGTITQLFGAGETECSVIMLWSYALASISLTLWSTIFMWLVA